MIEHSIHANDLWKGVANEELPQLLPQIIERLSHELGKTHHAGICSIQQSQIHHVHAAPSDDSRIEALECDQRTWGVAKSKSVNDNDHSGLLRRVPIVVRTKNT